jgi:hypothetical protein
MKLFFKYIFHIIIKNKKKIIGECFFCINLFRFVINNDFVTTYWKPFTSC